MSYHPFFSLLFLFTSTSAFAVFGSASVTQNTKDRIDCIPDEVQSVLKDVAAKFENVQIVSGYRGRSDNKRRGGADGSMHIQCKAADFLIPNRGKRDVQRQLQQFLLAEKAKYHVRYNVYCTGRSHVDNNNLGLPDSYSSCVEKETWRGSGGARNPKPKTFTRTRVRPAKAPAARKTHRFLFWTW